MGERIKRVLLIEDDLDTVRLVRGLLAQASLATFDLVSVGTLSEALKQLSDGQFDAVLTDLSLPDSRGPDTFRKIEERFPEVPIVVFTGVYDESLGIKALQQGAQDFLTKRPIDLQLLDRAILYAIERQRVRRELEELALQDPLTGLYNRRGLVALAEHQLSMARRERRAIVAVAVDVDGFKHINDDHGHEEGDRALVRIARVLRRTFRAPDVIARIGGDEFVVIAATAHPEAIAVIAARLRAHLRVANRSEGAPYQLSVSIGVSTIDPSGAKLRDVLHAADLAMYDDKRWRRGQGLRVSERAPTANGQRRHRSVPRRANVKRS
jgi:diguanylate cyclase (GGDEF)-like protein